MRSSDFVGGEGVKPKGEPPRVVGAARLGHGTIRTAMSLSRFHPIIAEWFRARFGSPTDVQARSWPAIAPGDDVLIAAPTGSGKTLAAFLSCLDALCKQARAGGLEARTHVVSRPALQPPLR